MNAHKRGLGISVAEAARQRINAMLDDCPRVIVSFSGGKDSTVMLHLVMEELARRPGRKIALLFIDLEAQYTLTIQHVADLFERYADRIEPYWLALPLSLRNAVSSYEPRWQCWDPDVRSDWVRTPPPMAIQDGGQFPWFERGMEFEELVEEFAEWYAHGEMTACFVGIRSDESLNRFRAIRMAKARWRNWQWTTRKGDHAINVYPIYDWHTRDIWTYLGRGALPYNRLYDRMHAAGLTLHQMRICQPYGDDQRKGLWLFHLIEPQTWGRVVARVNGANSGALYARQSGNILGVGKISLPEGHTWESFARVLMDSLPPSTQDHFREKFRVFRGWWHHRGYSCIPDAADLKLEASKKVPSWRRICKVLLRYDYWCKGLSFSQPLSPSMKRRTLAGKMRNHRRKETAKARRHAMRLPPEMDTWTK